MGYAIAQAAADMGADVTLVSGATALTPPANVTNISATSAENMYQAVMSNINKQDIFIGVAAVADYTPAKASGQKIKKSDSHLSIELTATKDILKDVASLPNAPFCVGFAAETENLIAHAEAKRKAKKLPLLVANLVGESMGQDEANITLLDKNGTHALPRADKAILATEILTHICSLI
jgi:phosphopantothenoylcysteine decarboxylase/phosphopantothenate--cysteine ligase